MRGKQRQICIRILKVVDMNEKDRGAGEMLKDVKERQNLHIPPPLPKS